MPSGPLQAREHLALGHALAIEILRLYILLYRSPHEPGRLACSISPEHDSRMLLPLERDEIGLSDSLLIMAQCLESLEELLLAWIGPQPHLPDSLI